MPQRLTAASLAAALCLAVPAARGAQDSSRTQSPPPASPPPPAGVPRGVGPGRGDSSAYPAEVGGERVFRTREVSQKAVITSKPEPGFTEEAWRNDTEGVVRLRAVLSSGGSVTNISVVKGLPDGLTGRAIAAARGIKFRPAQKDGRTVSQWVTLEYNFNTYVDESKVERPAVILEQPAPAYTEEARRLRTEGKVVLNLILHRSGRVAARVVSGLPHGLTEQAAEAASRLKFIPAEDKGRKVCVERRVEYVFSLD